MKSCWVKTTERSTARTYRCNGTDKIAGINRVMNNPKGKPWSFNNDGHFDKNFKTKSEALKFLKTYMKEHDSC